jgi:hypothetical protein
VQVAEFDREALAAAAPTVAALAQAEDLPAHARAVEVRLAEPAVAAGPARPARGHASPVPGGATP